MSSIDQLSGIVLGSAKTPTEHSDRIVPFLQAIRRCLRACAVRTALRAMVRGLKASIDDDPECSDSLRRYLRAGAAISDRPQ